MKNMKANSPLAANEKKMTNHSARKTAVKKMQRKGLSRSDIIAITGHASEKGLDSYDEGDERQQKTLSNIIDGITPNSRPSQGCFTADHQSPSVLTGPGRRPSLQEISLAAKATLLSSPSIISCFSTIPATSTGIERIVQAYQ